LNAIPPNLLGDVTFEPHSALRLAKSAYAIVSVTQANRLDTVAVVDDPYRPEWALVTRPEFEVMLTAVTASQFVFFQSLVAGWCLADAVDEAFALESEFDLASTLSLAFARGLFSSIALRTNHP
jgi:hypothetical protein